MTKRTSASSDYIFQKIAAGLPDDLSLTAPGRRNEARQWMRNQAADITQVDANRLLTRAKQNRKQTTIENMNIGQMFMFFYDAKHKKTLPYWDRFPMIFVIEVYNDGFLGINLHYLPPVWRAKLMDALYSIMNNNNYDRTTKLRVSYELLSGLKKFRFFSPCLKRYLSDHVQSYFMYIDPTEWDMALMLPTERFQKKNKMVVWQASVNKLRRKGVA